MTNNTHLFTLGYEGLSMDEFLELLRGAHVQVLADVRENPYSRKPLSEEVTGAGIEYQSWKPLGAPKPIRDRIKADNDWRAYTKGFLAHLEVPETAADVARLTALANEKVVCLLCYEADANRCHRRYVADAVQAAGGPMPVHLRVGSAQRCDEF